MIPVLLGTLLVVSIRKLLRVQDHNRCYIFLVAELFLGRGWIRLLTLDVLEVFGLHVAEGLVLEQHVVHKLVPLDTTVGVSVNLHEQLIELLISHLLPNDIFE
jgi:hypothetical protein